VLDRSILKGGAKNFRPVVRQIDHKARLLANSGRAVKPVSVRSVVWRLDPLQ